MNKYLALTRARGQQDAAFEDWWEQYWADNELPTHSRPDVLPEAIAKGLARAAYNAARRKT